MPDHGASWLAPLAPIVFVLLGGGALVGGYLLARRLHGRQGEAGPLALAAAGLVLAVTGGLAIRSAEGDGLGFGYVALPVGAGLALAGTLRWLTPRLQR